jgi:hypothetical protein
VVAERGGGAGGATQRSAAKRAAQCGGRRWRWRQVRGAGCQGWGCDDIFGCIEGAQGVRKRRSGGGGTVEATKAEPVSGVRKDEAVRPTASTWWHDGVTVTGGRVNPDTTNLQTHLSHFVLLINILSIIKFLSCRLFKLHLTIYLI